MSKDWIFIKMLTRDLEIQNVVWIILPINLDFYYLSGMHFDFMCFAIGKKSLILVRNEYRLSLFKQEGRIHGITFINLILVVFATFIDFFYFLDPLVFLSFLFWHHRCRLEKYRPLFGIHDYKAVKASLGCLISRNTEGVNELFAL